MTPAKETARQWLQRLLSKGPMKASAVIRKGEQAGHKERRIQIMAGNIGVVKTGEGRWGDRIWSLPPAASAGGKGALPTPGTRGPVCRKCGGTWFETLRTERVKGGIRRKRGCMHCPYIMTTLEVPEP